MSPGLQPQKTRSRPGCRYEGRPDGEGLGDGSVSLLRSLDIVPRIAATEVQAMIVRDVRCMSCARLLGRWVIVSEQKQGMLPPVKGEPIMAMRAGNSLRCKHC